MHREEVRTTRVLLDLVALSRNHGRHMLAIGAESCAPNAPEENDAPNVSRTMQRAFSETENGSGTGSTANFEGIYS
jgi:hypothetical protein